MFLDNGAFYRRLLYSMRATQPLNTEPVTKLKAQS